MQSSNTSAGTEYPNNSELPVIPMKVRVCDIIIEVTQAVIALIITGATVYSEVAQLETHNLQSTLLLVVGFYFGRGASRINQSKNLTNGL